MNKTTIMLAALAVFGTVAMKKGGFYFAWGNAVPKS